MSDKLPLAKLVQMLIKAEKELCEQQGLKPGVLIRLSNTELNKSKKLNG